MLTFDKFPPLLRRAGACRDERREELGLSLNLNYMDTCNIPNSPIDYEHKDQRILNLD